jgi:hypothetical protein
MENFPDKAEDVVKLPKTVCELKAIERKSWIMFLTKLRM